MNLLKKIGKKIIKTGFETVKEAGEQIGSTVSPDRIVAQVTGGEKSSQSPEEKGSEFSEYLKNLGPDLTQEQLKQKIIEAKSEEQEGINAAKEVIQSAIPAHMRLPRKSEEQPIYDKLWEEREKEEQAEKAQKAQEVHLQEPTAARKKGDLKKGLGRKKAATGMETKVNIKTG